MNTTDTCVNQVRPLFVFFVMIVLGPVSALGAQTVSQLIGQGDTFHKQFDTFNAFKAYKTAAESDSTNFEALWKMTYELIEMGNELPKSADQKNKYKEAEASARKAVLLNPNHAKGHWVLALAFEKVALDETGNERIRLLNQLRLEAEKGLGVNPKEDACHHLLGRWHRTVSNIGWVTKTWSKIFATSLPPASLEKSVEHFKKAIELNGNDLSHRLELGKTYVCMEKWNEAKEIFDKVGTMTLLTKNDRKWQRDAANYLQLLKTSSYSDLRDAVQE
jgi:tetratricopeptide (TPR) repeat protein